MRIPQSFPVPFMSATHQNCIYLLDGMVKINLYFLVSITLLIGQKEHEKRNTEAILDKIASSVAFSHF